MPSSPWDGGSAGEVVSDIHRQPIWEDVLGSPVMCPFHVECQFHNSSTKTPTDELLGQLFCCNRYDGCEIAKRLLADKLAGARPDGKTVG